MRWRLCGWRASNEIVPLGKPPSEWVAGRETIRSAASARVNLRQHESYLSINANDILFDASMLGDVPKLEQLISRGADVDSRDHFGRTPLIIASGRGHIQAVRYLIAMGASVDIVTYVRFVYFSTNSTYAFVFRMEPQLTAPLQRRALQSSLANYCRRARLITALSVKLPPWILQYEKFSYHTAVRLHILRSLHSVHCCLLLLFVFCALGIIIY